MNNKTILDFNDYPDISMDEFIDWFENKFFNKINIQKDTDWFDDRYDVDIIFQRDFYHNKFSLELKIVDVTDYPLDPYLEEQLKKIIEDKEK